MNQDLVLDKLKKIYMVDDGYQELADDDKAFFDRLFTLLWINDDIFFSNEYLASKFCIGKSTVEKKLRRIERANLIYREIYRENNNGKWTSQRRITLDSTLKALILKKLNMIPSEKVQEPEAPETIINNKIVNNTFEPTFKRGNR